MTIRTRTRLFGVARRAVPCLAALLCAVAAAAGESARPAGFNDAVAQAPAALIELDGSLSENPDGGQLQYEWRQVDGPPVVLSDYNAAKPHFRTAEPGLYRFELVVIANGLRSAPTPVEIEIERANLPPVAKAPTEIWGQVGKRLEIDGRESFDPEGASLTYRWRPLTRGLELPLSSLSMPVLTFEPTVDGVYEVELVVSDGETASPPAVTRIAVRPKPRPPVAKAKIIPIEIPTLASPEQALAAPAHALPQARIQGPSAVTLGEKVVLDAKASRSPSGGALSYMWRQKSGPFVAKFETLDDGAAEAFVPPRAGDYEFELVVADGSGDSQPVVHRLKVMRDPEPPVAVVVAPTRARPGTLVKMDATQSYDQDGAALSFRWRQTGGPQVQNYVIDERYGDSAPAFTPETPGQYVFELVVANGRLQSNPVAIAIEVAETPRRAELSVSGPEVAITGEQLRLAAAADLPASGDLRFVWTQAEGPADALLETEGRSVTVAPTLPGRYVFDIAAMDNGRVAATTRRALEVFGAPATPATTPIPAPPALTPPPAQPAALVEARPPAAADPSRLAMALSSSVISSVPRAESLATANDAATPDAPVLTPLPPPQDRSGLIPELQPLPRIAADPAVATDAPAMPALAPLPLASPMPMMPPQTIDGAPVYRPLQEVPHRPTGRAAARIHPAALESASPPVVDLP